MATRPVIGAQHHMLGTMSNTEMRESLFELLGLMIQDRDKQWLKATSRKLRSIFKQWKLDHGSRTPMTYRGSMGLGKQIPISFSAAAPYECSDMAADYVSLLFLLLRTKYPPLIALTDNESIAELAVIAAQIEPDMTRQDSLLSTLKMSLAATVDARHRARKFNARALEWIKEMQPDVAKATKARAQIKDVQPKGAAANQKKAKDRRANLCKAADDYFKANPYDDNDDDCARFLLDRCAEGTMRTIKDIIRGRRKVAQQRAKEKASGKG